MSEGSVGWLLVVVEGEAGGESEKMSERELVGGVIEGGLDGGVEDGFMDVILSCLSLRSLMHGSVALWF